MIRPTSNHHQDEQYLHLNAGFRHAGTGVRYLIFGIIAMLAAVTFPANLIDPLPESAHALTALQTTPDMLAYVSEDNFLMLYDPRQRTEVRLLDEKIARFTISPVGQIAYTRLNDPDPNLYTFDPLTSLLSIISFRGENIDIRPLEWSPDGRYLAIASYSTVFPERLYVWDGHNVINFTPQAFNGSPQAAWSADGRLLFRVGDGSPSEIYLWDGSTLLPLNAIAAAWSVNGEILFSSRQDTAHSSEVRLYVWDGVSFRDGVPDAESYIHVVPDAQSTILQFGWTNDGQIWLHVNSPEQQTDNYQILLWDLESQRVTRRIDIQSNYQRSLLSADGQLIFSTALASGLPSVYLDVENTEGQILFSTHTGDFGWSLDGYLAFCDWDWDTRQWTLTLWDGQETWGISQATYKPVQWKNRDYTFSCDND